MNNGFLLLKYGGRVGIMAYCIVRGGMASIGVAMFCWVGSILLFNRLLWLVLITILDYLCVCVPR